MRSTVAKGLKKIATRYGRCPVVFRVAIDVALAIIFWLGKE